MAAEASHRKTNTGFSTSTRTFHSLRPSLPLPRPEQPISAASFALRHLSTDNDHSSSTAIIDSDTGRRLSFANFLNQVRSLAASLRWLSKGSVAFVLAPNSPQVPILYFALLSIGVVVSPANPLGTQADISRQVHLSRPNVFFATTDTAHKLPSDLPIPVLLLHTQQFGQMLAGAAGTGETDVTVVQSDTAAILYSSGTTGHVKGVVLTHRNLIASIASFICFQEHRRCPHVNLVPVPFFHVLGFFKCLVVVTLGETMVLMQRFELGKALKAAEDYRVTSMPAAPPVVVAMARDVAATDFDLSSLEEVIYGGGPLADKYVAMFETKFPWVKLLPGYGMTEAGPVSSTKGLTDPCNGSVGMLCPYLEAKVVDIVAGEALFPGQSGELWLRGPAIMQGYVGDEAATRAVLDSEGWYRTGDMCCFDEKGRVHIVDRLKEMIKYKGYQVPPAELEQVLLSHPEIVDAAVIPYPHDDAGELPMAFVVRAPQSCLDHGQVIRFTAKRVAPYKKIRKVAFVESIPKNPAGKILRKELIKIAVSKLYVIATHLAYIIDQWLFIENATLLHLI